MLQAAEKLANIRRDLERQLEASRQKTERLTAEGQEARIKEEAAKAASLQAQVPSVAHLPCSVEQLFDGLLAKSYPQLQGGPEVQALKRSFEAAAAAALAGYNERVAKEQEKAREEAANGFSNAMLLCPTPSAPFTTPESRSRFTSAVSRRDASRAASESFPAAAGEKEKARLRVAASAPSSRAFVAVAPSGSPPNPNGLEVCRGSVSPSRVVLRHFARASSRRMPLRGSGRSAVDPFHARPRLVPRKSAPR